MSHHPDYFSDMLEPGEDVRATLGGAGAVHNGQRTWVQLALTEQRILAVVLTQGQLGGSYQPTQRVTAHQGQVEIRRFPRTQTSAARLEIVGLGSNLVLPDIDHPDLFPQVEPFVQAWGRPLGGAGTIQERAIDPLDAPPNPDTKMLIITGIAALAMFLVCCGGSTILLLVKHFVLPRL